MTPLAFHSVLLPLLAVLLTAGCASSHGAAEHEGISEGAVASGADTASDHRLGHDISWQLYERSCDYIVNDSVAAQVCGVPAPMPIRVWDTVGCPIVGWDDFPDIASFLYPTDRADSSRYYDSLFSRRGQPCGWHRDSAMTSLSTTADQRRMVGFWGIDSTFSPDYRIVGAMLYDKFWRFDNSILGDGDSTYSIGGEREILYLFVYDRAGALSWMRRWVDPFER